MNRPIVSNTTPLSTLARVDCLHWIPQRWNHVTIPAAVWREIALDEGLRVTGTAGMAKWALHQGLIPALRPMLERLRDEGGLYLSDAFIDRMAGE